MKDANNKSLKHIVCYVACKVKEKCALGSPLLISRISYRQSSEMLWFALLTMDAWKSFIFKEIVKKQFPNM